MENVNWIDINPVICDEKLCCKLKFKGCVDIILTTDEVKFLQIELSKYINAIDIVEKLVCNMGNKG